MINEKFLNGIIVKKISNSFVVKTSKGSENFFARGNLKTNGVFVGDEVLVDFEEKTIEKVLERENLLIRPPIANLSQLIITIAPVPTPAFSIVDKLILFCFFSKIKPVLCVNKLDICEKKFMKEIKFAYKNVCEIIFVSAKKRKNLNNLKKILKKKISAFAGQSGAGKSALVNAIFPKATAAIGVLSQKIEKGKHTTRINQLYQLNKNTYLADTPGFSKLNEKFLPTTYFSLCYYYPDFLPFHDKCKFKSCTHTNEPITECEVRNAVERKKLDRGRYERYLNIFEILREEWVKNHG